MEKKSYKYEALDDNGKEVSGTIEAYSSDDAVVRLRGRQLFPTSVNPIAKKHPSPASKKDDSELPIEREPILSLEVNAGKNGKLGIKAYNDGVIFSQKFPGQNESHISLIFDEDFLDNIVQLANSVNAALPRKQ